MTSPKIEVIEKAAQTTLGEAPHWCPEEQVLYYVDIIKGKVYLIWSLQKWKKGNKKSNFEEFFFNLSTINFAFF